MARRPRKLAVSLSDVRQYTGGIEDSFKRSSPTVENEPAKERTTAGARTGEKPPVQTSDLQAPHRESTEAPKAPAKKKQPAAKKKVEPKETKMLPMAAYTRALGKLDKNIRSTNLPVPKGGVFRNFASSLSRFTYEKGKTYNDLLPMHFGTGFESGLEHLPVYVTKRQKQMLDEAIESLTDTFRRHFDGQTKVVRANADSVVFRLALDFFLANAPGDCFEEVTGEQNLRERVGLPPLEDLELFRYAYENYGGTNGTVRVSLTETTLTTPSPGLYDIYSDTNLPGVTPRRGVTYQDLLERTFRGGFNASLDKKFFRVTSAQKELVKAMGAYYSRQMRNSKLITKSYERASNSSPVSRTIVDYFIVNAPAGCYDRASGEQEVRANFGLPPLPELEIYEHEITKQIKTMSD